LTKNKKGKEELGLDTLGDISHKIHAEAMFCAYEKSSCIDEEKGCNCGNCDLFKEYDLGERYFCIVSDGK